MSAFFQGPLPPELEMWGQASELWNGATQGVGDLWDGVTHSASAMWDGAKQGAADLWDGGIDAVSAVRNYRPENPVGQVVAEGALRCPPADVAAEWFADVPGQPTKPMLLRHYEHGGGKTFHLPIGLMKMMAPSSPLDAFRSPAIRALAERARSSGAAVTVPATKTAGTNNELGNYDVTYQGTLTSSASGEVVFRGTMSWFDHWDFDPKMGQRKGNASNRPLSAELAVDGVATLVRGQPFDIHTDAVAVEQVEGGAMVW